MKLLLAVSTLVALAACAPADQHYVSVTEDTLGNYKFSFDAGDHSKYEERHQDGNTHGHFDFVDPEGGHHKTEYKASVDQGFVIASADLPVAPAQEPENPEVVKARNEHLAIWQATADTNGIFEEEPAPIVAKTTTHKKVKVLVPVIQYVKP